MCSYLGPILFWLWRVPINFWAPFLSSCLEFIDCRPPGCWSGGGFDATWWQNCRRTKTRETASNTGYYSYSLYSNKQHICLTGLPDISAMTKCKPWDYFENGIMLGRFQYRLVDGWWFKHKFWPKEMKTKWVRAILYPSPRKKLHHEKELKNSVHIRPDQKSSF